MKYLKEEDKLTYCYYDATFRKFGMLTIPKRINPDFILRNQLNFLNNKNLILYKKELKEYNTLEF